MESMKVFLTASMKQYVDEQVSAGEYGDASEFIRELVRADQKRRAKERLGEVLVGALNSGDLRELTDVRVDEVRERLRARSGSRADSLPGDRRGG